MCFFLYASVLVCFTFGIISSRHCCATVIDFLTTIKIHILPVPFLCLFLHKPCHDRFCISINSLVRICSIVYLQLLASMIIIFIVYIYINNSVYQTHTFLNVYFEFKNLPNLFLSIQFFFSFKMTGVTFNAFMLIWLISHDFASFQYAA